MGLLALGARRGGLTTTSSWREKGMCYVHDIIQIGLHHGLGRVAAKTLVKIRLFQMFANHFRFHKIVR